MSTEGNQIRESFLAGADLSSSQYTFVKVNTTDDTVVAAGAGEAADGVLRNDPESSEAATVVLQGRAIVTVGSGGLTAGDDVTPDTNGAAVTATTGDNIVGRAIRAASQGERVAIDFFRSLSTA